MSNVTTDYEGFVRSCFAAPINDLPLERQLKWAISEMCGEAGEVSGLSAKATRKGVAIDKDKLLDELGDTLWGVTASAIIAGYTLEQLMSHNVEKLRERQKAKAA